PAASAFLGRNGEAKLLLERAADRATDGMGLPTGGFHQLGDGGAIVSAEEIDQQRLFAARAQYSCNTSNHWVCWLARPFHFEFRAAASLQRLSLGIASHGLEPGLSQDQAKPTVRVLPPGRCIGFGQP